MLCCSWFLRQTGFRQNFVSKSIFAVGQLLSLSPADHGEDCCRGYCIFSHFDDSRHYMRMGDAHSRFPWNHIISPHPNFLSVCYWFHFKFLLTSDQHWHFMAFFEFYVPTKQGMLYVLAGERIVRELRKEVFQALLRQEVVYFDVQTTGAPWLNSKRCGGMSPV